MKRFFNFSITANFVLALFAFLLADYSAANCQTAITATVPFQSNALATGRFTTFLKTDNGNTAQLTRPIIVIEGIDFFERFPALATDEDDVLGLLNTDRSHNLSNRLRAEGFDVVILNWGNSGDFLQNNAFLVVRLIEEVNRLKVGNEPNVLVGISMGGVVSRYALAWMEQNGRTHNVRQFISYDSPQVGANFPLGLQFWAQSFGAFNTSILNVAELAGVRSFNSESSKQMLKFHLTGVKSVNGGNVIEPISNHTNFYNEIEGLNNNLGYPLNCQNVAISNGAKSGVGFFDGGVAFRYNLGTATSGFVSDLPNTVATGLFGQFSGAGNSGFNLQPVSPEQDYDNAPGGFISWYSPIATAMANEGFNALVLPNQGNVAFIPTYSALGLTDPDIFRDITAWQDHENQIPFDSYYSPRLENQSHVALPTVTANWLHLQITSPNLWQINNATRSFNFGVNTNDFIFNNVNVSNGGVLGINTDRRTDAYEFNNTAATRQPFPNSLGFNNWFPVQTSSKRPVAITIGNNGSLELGSNQTNGLLRIKTGSTLHLRTGSTLSLIFNSRIEIEDGGRMIIDADANINFVDETATIIIKSGGELVINGSPTITGDGHFRFEQGNIFTLNNNALLRGSNRDIPLIVIATGATIAVTNPRELSIADASVVHESGNLASDRHIWLKNGATFMANNVFFDDKQVSLNYASFIDVEDPTDSNNDPDDVDYGFTNCRFQNGMVAVNLDVPYAQTNAFDWRNLNVSFVGCQFDRCKALYADRSYITLFDNCTLTNSNIEINHTYWLNVRNTTIRGTGSGVGIKSSTVAHFWFRDNSLIDQFTTGIEATDGINFNIIMTDQATIQRCFTGIHLNGFRFGPGDDLGLLHMDCARMIQNVNGIRGRDIIFGVRSRLNATSNNFTRSPDDPTGLFIESLFDNRRNETDVWLDGNFWGGVTPQATPTVNADWAFRVRTDIPQAPVQAWTGTIHNDDTRTDVNDPIVQNCGGVALRDNTIDPLAQRTIVNINGVLRDVKIQQDAGWRQLGQKNLAQTLNLLRPVANLPNSITDTASNTVNYLVDVARAFTLSERITLRSAAKDDGWLPETIVGYVKSDGEWTISPNPADNTVQLDIEKGNYHLRVSNTVGQTIFSQNTEGPLSVNVATWTNGIYLFELTDKATNKQQRSKIVVQH